MPTFKPNKNLTIKITFQSLISIMFLIGLGCFFEKPNISQFLLTKVYDFTPGSSFRERWTNPEDSFTHVNFYFHNLTNYEEFKKGSEASYNTIGPIKFKLGIKRRDLTVASADGAHLKFRNQIYYRAFKNFCPALNLVIFWPKISLKKPQK